MLTPTGAPTPRETTGVSLRVAARPYKRTAEPGQGRVYDEMMTQGHVVEELSITSLFRGKWDIAHLHYPEAALRRKSLAASIAGVATLAAILFVCRVRRISILGTGHNLKSHEGHHPRLESVVRWMFDRNVDAMTYPSLTAQELIVEGRPKLADVESAVVPLTNYRWQRTPLDPVDARNRLHLPEQGTIILFLGLIRRYKNVPDLISVFGELGRSDVHLVIAGNPADSGLEAEVRDAAASAENVHLALRYIEQSEVDEFMAAADLVALPFQAVLNSASTLLALSHSKPVLVPRTGALEELAGRVGPSWLHFFDGPLSQEALLGGMSHAGKDVPDEPDLGWCDVEEVARRTEDFYERVRS